MDRDESGRSDAGSPTWDEESSGEEGIMKARRVGRGLALVAAGAAILGFVTISFSQEARKKEEAPSGARLASDEPVVDLGGLRVAIDPETGDLRPLTKQEAARLAREMRRRFAPRDIGEPTLRPDGAMSAVVVPNVLRFSVAKIQDDGTVALDCTEGNEDAIEHLTHSATAVPLTRDEK